MDEDGETIETSQASVKLEVPNKWHTPSLVVVGDHEHGGKILGQVDLDSDAVDMAWDAVHDSLYAARTWTAWATRRVLVGRAVMSPTTWFAKSTIWPRLLLHMLVLPVMCSDTVTVC